MTETGAVKGKALAEENSGMQPLAGRNNLKFSPQILAKSPETLSGPRLAGH